MASKKFPLQVVIEGVDNLSAPLRRINKQISEAFKPARQLGQSFKLLAQESGITKMGKAFYGFGTAVRNVGTEVRDLTLKLAAMAGVVGGIFYTLVKQTADMGDKFNDLAPRVGVSVQALSELAYAAQLNDLSFESLEGGLIKLNKNMVAARTGSKEMANWFKRAGVSVVDAGGKMKSADVVLTELADKFQAMPDGAKKTALAIGIFGKSGADLIPLLNSGSAAIGELRRRAQELGVTFDEKTAAAAGAFNDSLDTLKFSLAGLRNIIGNTLIPVLQPMLEKMTAWVLANRELVSVKVKEFVERLPEILSTLSQVLSVLLSITNAVAGAFKFLIDTFGASYTVFGTLAVLLAGPMIAAVGGLITAFTTLAAVFGATPIGWAFALVTAAALVIANWEKVKSWFGSFFSWIGEGFRSMVPDSVLRLFGAGGAPAPAAVPTRGAVEGMNAVSPQGANARASLDINATLPPGVSLRTKNQGYDEFNVNRGTAMVGFQ